MSEHVLIADGDAERGKLVAEACAGRGLSCTVTSHGAAALEAALAESPAALVCHLDLPLIDGARLAAILDANPRTRGVSMIFLSDGQTPRREEPPGRVIAAPIDPEQVASCVQALVVQSAPQRERLRGDEGGVDGQLAELPLADLLELFHVSRKTGLVELVRRNQARRDVGRIVLRGGDVVHASVGEVAGVKALFRLLAWDRGSFSFRPGPARGPESIETPTRMLLREGQRQLEEWGRVAVDLPPMDAEVRLSVERKALPNVIHPLTQEVLLVLELHGRVREVVERCAYPDYQVLRTLATLIARGFVELRREPDSLPPPDESELFSSAHVTRLREWLGGPGGGPRSAKLLVASSGLDATRAFTRWLPALPGLEIEARVAAGAFDATDLIPLGRITVEDDLGLDLVHLPTDPSFAPFWPTAGHGALGTLLLLAGPVERALEAVRAAAETLAALPRARRFHLLLVEAGERVRPETIREHLSLLEDGSLFLVPLEHEEKAAALLREVFHRVVP